MQVRYKTNYLIIGSGAAGGTIFKELIDRGIDCLVVEEGEWLETKDFAFFDIFPFVIIFKPNKKTNIFIQY